MSEQFSMLRMEHVSSPLTCRYNLFELFEDISEYNAWASSITFRRFETIRLSHGAADLLMSNIAQYPQDTSDIYTLWVLLDYSKGRNSGGDRFAQLTRQMWNLLSELRRLDCQSIEFVFDSKWLPTFSQSKADTKAACCCGHC